MNSIVEQIRANREASRAVAIKRYSQLVAKLAGDDKLKSAEESELDELLTRLAITTLDLGQHIEAVKKAREAEAQIVAGETARASMPALQSEINKFNERRQKILDDLDRESSPLNRRGTLLNQQLSEGEAARLTIGEVRGNHPLAFGLDPNLAAGTRLTEEEQIALHADDDKKRIANFLAATVRDGGTSEAWNALPPAEFSLLKLAVESGWISRPIPAPPEKHEYVAPVRVTKTPMRLQAEQRALASRGVDGTWEEKVEREEAEIRRARNAGAIENLGIVTKGQP